MSLKVCLVTGSFPNMKGGVSDYSLKLAKSLNNNHNININIITTMDSNVKTNCQFPVHTIIKNWGISNIYFLKSKIEDIKPDILHIQYPASGYGRGLAVNFTPLLIKIKKTNIPVILTLHDFKVSHLLRKAATLPLIVFSDKIVVSNEREERYVKQNVPLINTKIEVIPIGSNIDVVDIEEETNVEDNNSIVLSYFGFIHKMKKIEILLSIVSSLVEDGYDIHLKLIGGIGDNGYYEKLKKKSTKLGIDEKITWTGYCSDEETSYHLNTSDICILPFADGISFKRGSFIAVLQHHLPVISTYKAGYIPSQIEHWKNKWLFSIEDVKGMEKAVKNLINDDNLRKKRSLEAKELSCLFEWSNIAEKYYSLYKEF